MSATASPPRWGEWVTYRGRPAVVLTASASGLTRLRTEDGEVQEKTADVVALSRLTPPTPGPLPARGPMKRLHSRWPFMVQWGNRLLPAPTLADLEGELKAIKAAFGANGPVKCRSRATRYGFRFALDFVSPRIILGGDEGTPVDLGPFKVSLYLDVGSGSVGHELRVKALEPHYPAGLGTNNPHPHVSRDELCLGEAHGSFEVAMRAGRLADAAELAVGVLAHYNPETAYVHVTMRNWDGHTCGNCGVRSPSAHNGGSRCAGCEEEACGGCLTRTSRPTYCGCRMHAGCVGAAPVCSAPGCENRWCGQCARKSADGTKSYCHAHSVKCLYCYGLFAPDVVVDGYCPDRYCQSWKKTHTGGSK